jgi:hypothetical protein
LSNEQFLLQHSASSKQLAPLPLHEPVVEPDEPLVEPLDVPPEVPPEVPLEPVDPLVEPLEPVVDPLEPDELVELAPQSLRMLGRQMLPPLSERQVAKLVQADPTDGMLPRSEQ